MPTDLRAPRVWLGLGFLAFAFVMGRLDLPAAAFLGVLLVSVAVGAYLLVTGRPPVLVVWLGSLVGLAVACPQLLGLARGLPIDIGQLVFGVAIAVAAWAAAAVPPQLLRWSVLGVLAAVVWAGLAVGFAALIGVVGYGLFEVPGHDRDAFGIGQLRGVMPHPNTMGIFAGLAVVLAYRQVMTDFSIQRRRAWGIALAVGVPAAVALTWSQSRTSAIATVAGLVVASLPLRRRGTGWLGLVAALGAVAMIVAPLVVARTTDYDFNGRSLAWQYATQEFANAPTVGFGPGFFSTGYWTAYPGLEWFPVNAHNLVMQAAGESGLVGLVTLSAAIAVMAVVAVRTPRWDWQWGLIVFVMFCVLGGQEATLSIPVRSGVVLTIAVLASSWMLRQEGTGAADGGSSQLAAPS
jgi:O-antigen ligase